jgi:hypothetical protein
MVNILGITFAIIITYFAVGLFKKALDQEKADDSIAILASLIVVSCVLLFGLSFFGF